MLMMLSITSWFLFLSSFLHIKQLTTILSSTSFRKTSSLYPYMCVLWSPFRISLFDRALICLFYPLSVCQRILVDIKKWTCYSVLRNSFSVIYNLYNLPHYDNSLVNDHRSNMYIVFWNAMLRGSLTTEN